MALCDTLKAYTFVPKLFTLLSPVGGASSLRPFSGVSPHPPSARLWPSSMVTAVLFSLPTSSKLRYGGDWLTWDVHNSDLGILSAITLVPTPSASSLARRTRGSRLARTSVSSLMCLYQLWLWLMIFLYRRQLDWPRW